MASTTKGSKAYGMISYAKNIFPPLPVMIEKLIFDRAYTGLHVVTNMWTRCCVDVFFSELSPINTVRSYPHIPHTAFTILCSDHVHTSLCAVVTKYMHRK